MSIFEGGERKEQPPITFAYVFAAESRVLLPCEPFDTLPLFGSADNYCTRGRHVCSLHRRCYEKQKHYSLLVGPAILNNPACL